MIALLARAQALGTALDPKLTMVRLGTWDAGSTYGSAPNGLTYAVCMGEDEGHAPSYEPALRELVTCQRQRAKRECIALSAAIGNAASVQAQCFALATLLVDAADEVIHVEQKHWPAGPLPCFYNIRVEGLRHEGAWADENLDRAWQKAVEGLRALGNARIARLTEALAADDKAAKS